MSDTEKNPKAQPEPMIVIAKEGEYIISANVTRDAMYGRSR